MKMYNFLMVQALEARLSRKETTPPQGRNLRCKNLPKEERTPPCPPQGGNLLRKILK
jgi:hypothetical protein